MLPSECPQQQDSGLHIGGVCWQQGQGAGSACTRMPVPGGLDLGVLVAPARCLEALLIGAFCSWEFIFLLSRPLRLDRSPDEPLEIKEHGILSSSSWGSSLGCARQGKSKELPRSQDRNSQTRVDRVPLRSGMGTGQPRSPSFAHPLLT